REGGKEGKRRDRRDVSGKRKRLQHGYAIRHDHPGAKDQRQRNSSVNAHADRGVPQGFKPAVTWQLHGVWHGSGHPTKHLCYDMGTRNYDGGCATSTAMGGLGTLSLPALSTAVTLYQYFWPLCTEVSRYAGVGNNSLVSSAPFVPSCSLR